METVITGKPQSLRYVLQELWRHRELFYFLVWRDIKIRYKQTVIGIGWAFIQPFLTMIVLSFVFGTIAKIVADGIPYPVFVYSGFLLWNFFSRSITAAADSLIGNQALVKNVPFPRVILPLTAIVVNAVDLVFSFLILALLMFFYQIIPPLFSMFILFYTLIMLSFLAAGVGSILAVWNTLYRDIRFLIPYILQLVFFLTPIIYPGSLVAERYRLLILLNPLAVFIEFVRSGLFGSKGVSFYLWTIASVISITIFFLGFDYVRRKEQQLTDIV